MKVFILLFFMSVSSFAAEGLKSGVSCQLKDPGLCKSLENKMDSKVLKSIDLVQTTKHQGNCFWFALSFYDIEDFKRPRQLYIFDEEKLWDMGLSRVSYPVEGAIVLFVEYGSKMHVQDTGGRLTRVWQDFREPFHMAYFIDGDQVVLDKQGPRSKDFRIKTLEQLTKEVNNWSKHRIEVQYYVPTNF